MNLAERQIVEYPRPSVETGGPEWPGPCSHLPVWWPIGDWDHMPPPPDMTAKAEAGVVWAWPAWGTFEGLDEYDEVLIGVGRRSQTRRGVSTRVARTWSVAA